MNFLKTKPLVSRAVTSKARGFFIMIGIYKITNPNGKIYIGQSVDIEKRWKLHKYVHESGRCNYHLYNSFRKYGFDAHIFEVVEECMDSELNDRERYYQDKYNSIKEGLNSRYTKSNDKSGRLSEETLKKLSNIRKGRIAPNKGKPMPEHQRIAQTGRKLSDEAKQKISEANKKAWSSKEKEDVELHNKRHSMRMMGSRNPMFGKVHSDDVTKKMKEKAIGRYSLNWFIQRYGEIDGKVRYDKRIENTRKCSSKPVTINGVTYKSMMEASAETGLSIHMIRKYYL
jgi:group I intron endonuclease